MSTTSRTDREESRPRVRRSVVSDVGGLVVGQTIRTSSTPRKPLSARRDEGLSGTFLAPLSPDATATVVGIAARAPSVHNTQPWRFRTAGNVIELYADPDRLLKYLDPAGRELVISCGAALFGLRLGMRHFGRVPAVQLWPDGAEPWLLARIWAGEKAATNSIEAELLAAVPHRHTHRGPFTPGEVSTRLLAALATDAVAEGAELMFVEAPDLVSGLDALVDQAAADQEASAAISEETRRWLRPDDSQSRDGVPARATAADGEKPVQRFRQRGFGTLPGLRSSQPGGEPPAATAVLITATDTADDWLRAGQALNRLLLRAATRWVFASLQSQPLEVPRYREHVQDLLSISGQPQMLLQFGRSNTALATPRRRQAEYRTNEKQS